MGTSGRARFLFSSFGVIAAAMCSISAQAATNPVPAIYGHLPAQAVEGGTVPITIAGSGFLPSTVILVNGSAVATTYQSATSVVAQVSGPKGSTGNLSVQAQNPKPGGGTSASTQIPVATLQLTATNPNGNNTGTAVLGVPVNFTAVNTDTAHSGGAWTLNGVGTLTTSGFSNGSKNLDAVYSPPTKMPANTAVAVTVYLQSLPALATVYRFTLVNPVPVVTSASPKELLPGGSQKVTLTGSGFVPSMTVLVNGTILPTTYISYTQATVQVPVAENATGSLKLQATTPAPGGGAGTTFTESIEPPSLSLTATGQDGVNTGYADEDFNVAMSATVSGSLQSGINWSVVGPGTISSTGVYTPPSPIPDNHYATIYATLASNSKIAAHYAVNIVNPIPALTGTTPSIVHAGTTTATTLAGTGFVPSTIIEVNGAAAPTKYVSPASIIAQITAASTATGSLALQAYTASNKGGSSGVVDLAVSTPASARAAARLLDQTTFGPTASLIQHVQSEGLTAWLNEQYNTPATLLPLIPQVLPSYTGSSVGMVESEWWQTVITGNDQLRQRVAFTLSQLFVISTDTVTGWDVQYYTNKLAKDAFSNWYTIMTDVTLSPGMGQYLNMLNSGKPSATLIANENFARENMQLFNLGLNLINQDGSLKLDSAGNPIPTYTEAQVQAFARAFTGWTYANSNGSVPSSFNYNPNFYSPMVAVESQHDESSKTLLNGTVLPSGQSAEEDLSSALKSIFEHPNLPPFVSRQLIQHLVKSDPSPAYISRVAAVFINDGNDVRGDMKAVLTAILTDSEARAGDTSQPAYDGHLREPILWLTGVMRGLGYVNVDPNNYWQSLSNNIQTLGERPFASPSVFNFFSPNYVIPGTSLNAPEFGLENTASIALRLSLADSLLANFLGSFNVDMSATSPLGKVAALQGPAALVNALNSLFLHGTLDPATAAAITSEVSTVSDTTQQVRLAAYLVVTSTEYLVSH